VPLDAALGDRRGRGLLGCPVSQVFLQSAEVEIGEGVVGVMRAVSRQERKVRKERQVLDSLLPTLAGLARFA